MNISVTPNTIYAFVPRDIFKLSTCFFLNGLFCRNQCSFHVGDCLTFKSDKTFDLAISSGVAGNQGGPADHPTKLKQFLLNMKNHASKVVVNFPSTWATIRSENIEYFSPSSTLEIALSVTENVQLIHKTKFDFLLILE